MGTFKINKVFFSKTTAFIVTILSFSFPNNLFACHPPAPPVNIVFSATSTTLTINADNNTETGGSNCAYYMEIELRCLSEPFTNTPNHISGLVSNPNGVNPPVPFPTVTITICPGVTYHFQIRQTNTETVPQSSPWTSAFTFTAPGAMTLGAGAFPSTICVGGSTSLLATPNPQAACSQLLTYIWSPAASLNNPSIQNPIATPTVTTTYTVIATNCNSQTSSAIITINVQTSSTAPTSIIAAPNPVCSGAQVGLTVQGGSLGNGAIWKWYSGSCGGVLVGQGTSPSILVNPTTTTTYFVRAEGVCGNTSCASVTVFVNPLPLLSITNTNENCALANDGTATVSATGNGPFSYAWSTIPVQTGSTATGLNAGTYSVIVTDANGCTASVSVTIGTNIPVFPAAPIVTASAPNLCGSSTITYTITNFNSNFSYSYTASPTPISVTNNPTNVFVVDWGASCPNVVFTITPFIGNPICSGPSTSVTVYQCCPCNPALLDIVTGTNITSASQLLNLNHPAISGNTYNNQNGNVNFGTLYINGTFTIDVPFLFIVNSRVKFGGGAIINIPNGSGNILTIDKSVLTAGCGNMWDGIYVSSTSELVSIINKSVVEDAYNVVVSNNGGDFFIDRSKLNRNFKGVIVKNYNGVHPGLIWRSDITCLATQLNNFNIFLLPPHATERTSIGVDVSNVDFFTVGNNNQNNYTNTFDNMDVGIKSFDCNLSVFNNKFISITNQPFPPNNTTGRAIWTTGIGETVTIGGLGNIAPNKFDNCGYGVYAQYDQDIFILNNDFKNHTRAGIYITRLDEVNIVRITNKNKFNNMPNGIWCYDNPQADILIDDNDINVGVNPANLGNGIIVQEVFLVSTNPYKITTITNNRIKSVAHGIWTQNMKGNILIQDNKITTTNPPLTTPIPFTEGIFIENTFFAKVVGNEVTSSTLSADWWMNGIRVSGATNIITCNKTHDIGRGLFFDGVETPNTGVALNEMQNNHTGLLLNWGVIGAQGFLNIPYDNQWLGTMSACYTDAWASNGNLSPFLVRSGGLPYNPFASTNCNNQSGTLISSSTCTGCTFPLPCPVFITPVFLTT